MSANRRPAGGGAILNALLLLVLVAAGGRIAYELLAPLLPSLVVLLLVGFVLLSIFRR